MQARDVRAPTRKGPVPSQDEKQFPLAGRTSLAFLIIAHFPKVSICAPNRTLTGVCTPYSKEPDADYQRLAQDGTANGPDSEYASIHPLSSDAQV